MLLKFDEFIALNEKQSTYTCSMFKRDLGKYGWTLSYNDNVIKIYKGGKLVYDAHKKHTSNSPIDIDAMDTVRAELIKDFLDGADNATSEINAVSWNLTGRADPFYVELKNYDKKSGKRILTDEENLLKSEEDRKIAEANEEHKDDHLEKISHDDPDSYYLMSHAFGNVLKYNVCKSPDDRRPLMDEWFSGTNYKRKGSSHYFGIDDMEALNTKFYKLNSDGTLSDVVSFIAESKNIQNNLDIL